LLYEQEHAVTPDDWSELELISSRIDDLRHRRICAERIGKRDRTEALTREIALAQRLRDLVVDRITARFVDRPLLNLAG
jgi:hypothetical protein